MLKPVRWAFAAVLVALSPSLAQAQEARRGLFDAVVLGDPAVVSQAIQDGADVNARDSNGLTALAYAAQLDEPEVVTTLMNAGARPWSTDPTTSPLMIAAASGSNHVIGPLLSKGIPPVSYNDALTVAAGRGDPFAVAQFVKASGLSDDDKQALIRKLNARLRLEPSDDLSPDAALLSLNLCRDAGFYTDTKCLSNKLLTSLANDKAFIGPKSCDILTSYINDPDRLPGLSTVDPKEINLDQAMTACRAAIMEFPNEARFYTAAARLYLISHSTSSALPLLKKAIDKGSRFAVKLMGDVYSGSYGRDNFDRRLAGEYYGKAANLGICDAFDKLSSIYSGEEGGVTKDNVKASKLSIKGCYENFLLNRRSPLLNRSDPLPGSG